MKRVSAIEERGNGGFPKRTEEGFKTIFLAYKKLNQIHYSNTIKIGLKIQ